MPKDKTTNDALTSPMVAMIWESARAGDRQAFIKHLAKYTRATEGYVIGIVFLRRGQRERQNLIEEILRES